MTPDTTREAGTATNGGDNGGGARSTRSERGETRVERAPSTIVEVVERAMRVHARADALNYKRKGEWRPISSEEFLRRVRRVALGLHSLGLARGDRAGILSESSPEWVLVDVGCQFAGVINVPVYPTLAPQQVCYILEDSGARLLFVQDSAALERARAAVGGCRALSNVVVMEGEAGGDGALTLEELEARGAELEASRPGLLEEVSGAISPEDLATIIYTSGTTGEPIVES